MTQSILFVTGNLVKVKHARVALRPFGLRVVQKQVQGFIEPRAEDPEGVSAEKALQAYQILQRPLMVEDSGLYIRGLQGFPKTYVHFSLETLGVRKILKMMEGEADRYAEFRQSLAYIDGSLPEPVVFSYVDGGYRVVEALAAGCENAYDCILIPPGGDRPNCRYSTAWRARRDASMNAGKIHYHQLAAWIGGR